MYLRSRNVALAPNSRPARFGGREAPEELVLGEGPEAVSQILRHISLPDGELSKGKRLAYLNAFVKHLQSGRERGYTTPQILVCLRVVLVHEATVIRLAGLRVLRYLLNKEEDVVAMVDAGIPFLIVRSMDIILNNSSERTQATRLCQRILAIPNGAPHFPSVVTRALIAIGMDGQAEQDKLYRGSLSLLCQLALLNPMQFIDCGGVRVLLHNILGCSSPMVLEAMVGSLLHLLNVPETRDASGVNLSSLVAPFTDVHFKHGANEPAEKGLDEREVGYTCAKTAIGTVLKSWSGIAHFCQSKNSGLQALIDALYIEQLEIRKIILDLICDILGVTFPTWSDEVSVALSAVDPAYPQDSWKLSEDFVVSEADSVLPHLALSTPNITANHMALLVLSFIQKGLLEALVEVIVTGDTFISVRGTVLLGELLYLVDKYIPLACYDPSQCIPTLIRYSAGAEDENARKTVRNSLFSSSVGMEVKQQRAMEALSVLSSLQKIKARRPSPSSLFLQAQLDYASYVTKGQGKFLNKLGQAHVSRMLKRDIEQSPGKLLKECGILSSKDNTTWQWDTIVSLIKWAPMHLKKVDDSSWLKFLKRLIDYFKPSSNQFARLELGKGQGKIIAKAGLALVYFLSEEVMAFSGGLLLEELLNDIGAQLDEVLLQAQNPTIAFLSPQKLEASASATQTYFLMIGKLSDKKNGLKALDKSDILKRFYNIVMEVQTETYAKLVISSLSYKDEYCRRVLAAALASPYEATRLYATKFLRVLLRLGLSGLSQWGMELIVAQLRDKSKAVVFTALEILEEGIHDKMFLESLIALRPSLTVHGDRGHLLLITFTSLPSGFKFLSEANFLKNEIVKWRCGFNKRYVELVEVLVRDCVSTLRRGPDGKYPKRASRATSQNCFPSIHVPPHLYGQLAQGKEGLELLLEEGGLPALIATILNKRATKMEETRELKAALWALAHLGTAGDAVSILEESGVLEAMVELGRHCPVLSVRHTVFHCLCLLCVTVGGCEYLRKWGWYGMPRNHHENFTIWSQDTWERDIKEANRRRIMDEFVTQDDEDKGSLCSHLLMEEDAELELMEEELEDAPKESPNFTALEEEEGLVALKTSSLTTGTGSLEARSLSAAHHRSQSDSQALSGNSGGVGLSLSPQARARTTTTTSSSSKAPRRGSFGLRWRKGESVSESTTSGVSSCDSSTLAITKGQGAELGHTQTLSPIPSSASIATTSGAVGGHSYPLSMFESVSPPSRCYSGTSGLSGGGGGVARSGSLSYHSPAHRSLRMRKPVIRMPSLNHRGLAVSDYDFDPPEGQGPARRGSLDRQFFGLSPGDLFQARGVGSSLTSISTPSFRIRPEVKGPCYMGLAVPRDFSAIFLTDSSIPLHVRNSPKRALGDGISEAHNPLKCMACYQGHKVKGDVDVVDGLGLSSLSLKKEEMDEEEAAERKMVRKEVLSLVSNLICCVGAKANEQGLLKLKNTYTWAFQDVCLYNDTCTVVAEYNLRLPLRRFIQELFYDLHYRQFYEAAEGIVGSIPVHQQRQSTSSSIPVTPTDTVFEEQEAEQVPPENT